MKNQEMQENERIRKFIARHKRDLKRVKVALSVGCNHGFRKSHDRCSKAELLSLRVGEDDRLYQAIIHNGYHPDYQNGKELLPKYRRMLARRAS